MTFKYRIQITYIILGLVVVFLASQSFKDAKPILSTADSLQTGLIHKNDIYNTVYRLVSKVDYSKHFKLEKNVLNHTVTCQIILESGWYRSKLAINSNNPLGHKAKGNEPFVQLGTWEIVKGKKVNTTAKFRKYKSINECIENHFTSFLLKPRYKKVRSSKSIYEFFIRLQQSGYATDKNYPIKLINIYLGHEAEH